MGSVNQQSKPAGLLLVFGCLMLFGSVAFGADAGWRTYRRYVESTQWPAIDAELADCRIHTWYDSTHGRRRSSHYVQCVFRYEVADRSYETKADVGSTVSVVDGQINLTQPSVSLASLERWVHQHRKGSIETIHYDPSNPRSISLAGVDDEISIGTPTTSLQGVALFGCAGMILLVVGRRLR
jgi:Protein of unknown function (DUF3592)